MNTHAFYTHTIAPAQFKQLPSVIVFDCRHDLAQPGWGAVQYAINHLNRAHFAGLDTHLSGPKTGLNGRHPLPNREAFCDWLAQCGVTPQTQIVCYDQLDGMFAARLWWMCRWAGLCHVAVLAGGFNGWQASGGAVDSATTVVQSTTPWRLPALEQVIAADAVLAQLAEGTRPLVDARAPERYRGEVEPLDRVAGHIPGAVNRFFKRNVTAQGGFEEDVRSQWQALLDAQGVHPMQLIHTCGSGATACHNILALHVTNLLQPSDASTLYAGSWSEWCADPTKPVAKG